MTAARGTTNRNARGGSKDRAARRQWLVETFRANVDVGPHPPAPNGNRIQYPLGGGIPACRCYRCGVLLTVDEVSADRIIPGAEGGTYRRNNIRPACAPCQSHTGGKLSGQRRVAKNGNRR